jgi:site-specific DNA recombinase
MVRPTVLWDKEEAMTLPSRIRCAVYTRKSSEEGLEQSFNSLDAQREACEAYILSQKQEGWLPLPTRYDDGGYSGGNMDRPALKHLLADIAAKKIDTVVVYKVDRLTRSLADFAKIVEAFDRQGISFVSVTQQFNTTTSMGRLTLNVLLSFAQFEREVTGERIRDKIAASKRKGMWMGGVVPMGYSLEDRHLIVQPEEAAIVRRIFDLYLKLGCVAKLRKTLERDGIHSKERTSESGRRSGGVLYSRGALYAMLQNRIYRGEITHKDDSYPGQHQPIIDRAIWDQVQELFRSNLKAERRHPRSTEPSLLTGLLYDDQGNRFTPSHSSKKGRRYRYYVSQALIQGKDCENRSNPLRLPAEEIEGLVLSQLNHLLTSPQRMLDLMVVPSATSLELERCLRSLEQVRASPELSKQLLRTTVSRVVVYDNRVELHIDKRQLALAVLGQKSDASLPFPTESEPEPILLSETASLCHTIRGRRFRLSPDSNHTYPRPASSLINAVVKAHYWLDRILRGELRSQRDLANETGLDERYIGHILPLAFLAPDITESILEGRHSPHLSIHALCESIPSCWSQQRTQLGLVPVDE